MRFQFDDSGRTGVVHLQGRLTGGADASTWHDALRQRCAQGHTRVVVDCRNVDRVDATGLGALVGALAVMRNAGGDLAIACMPDALRSLLLITRLAQAIPCFDTVDAAARALDDPAGVSSSGA